MSWIFWASIFHPLIFVILGASVCLFFLSLNAFFYPPVPSAYNLLTDPPLIITDASLHSMCKNPKLTPDFVDKVARHFDYKDQTPYCVILETTTKNGIQLPKTKKVFNNRAELFAKIEKELGLEELDNLTLEQQRTIEELAEHISVDDIYPNICPIKTFCLNVIQWIIKHINKLLIVLGTSAVAFIYPVIKDIWKQIEKARLSQEPVGYRQQFEKNFKRYLKIQKHKRLIIFLDDLDRCNPEQVLQVMEAINFMASIEGGCFIIVGMASKHILECVGFQFKDFIQEQAKSGASKTKPLSRDQYARSYLEKIINVEVPAPSPRIKHISAINKSDEPENRYFRWQKTSIKMRYDKFLKHMEQLLKKLSLLSGNTITSIYRLSLHTWGLPFILLFILMGIFIQTTGYNLPLTNSKNNVSDKIEINSSTQSIVEQPPRSLSQTPEPITDSATISLDIPDTSSTAPLDSKLIFGLAIASIIFILLLIKYRDRRPSDSEELIQALNSWKNVIACCNDTPRTIKRYENRLRYFAMRHNLNKEESSYDGNYSLTYDELVALGTLHYLNPDWLENISGLYEIIFAKHPIYSHRKWHLADGNLINPELLKVLAHTISKLTPPNSSTNIWIPTDETIKQFKYIAGELKITIEELCE